MARQHPLQPCAPGAASPPAASSRHSPACHMIRQHGIHVSIACPPSLQHTSAVRACMQLHRTRICSICAGAHARVDVGQGRLVW